MTAALHFGPRPLETVFGQRLAEIRERRRMLIERFAMHCRVSQTSMESWISDGCEPLLGYAFKVACAVGYDVEDLADPCVLELPAQRRPDSPRPWTFEPKGSVCSTQFGATLRAALRTSDRTIKSFAADLRLSRCTVNDWTLGRTEPRLTSAMRAADDLGLSLHSMCAGRAEPRRAE